MGQLETFPALSRMSAVGGKADVPAAWSRLPLVSREATFRRIRVLWLRLAVPPVGPAKKEGPRPNLGRPIPQSGAGALTGS